MKFCRSVALAAFFALAGGGAMAQEDTKPAEATPPDNPKLEVARGDRWTYEVRDDLTGDLKSTYEITTTDVTGSEIDVRFRYTNAATNQEGTASQAFDARWRQKDNGTFLINPGIEEMGVPTDIKVGKTWSYAYDSSRVNPPAHVKWAGQGKVVSWERVQLANGLSYDAFKIDYDTAVTPVVNNRKMESHVVAWYAPAANRVVKCVVESRQNGKLYDASVETLRSYTQRAR